MPHLKPPVGPDDHAQGPATAAVTLVEYGDYECPHCGRAYPLLKAIQERMGDRLRFVYRNFPLAESHPHAVMAAEAAEAAAAESEDAFWAMHDALFEHQRELSERTILRLADDLGLEVESVAEALRSRTYEQRVRADFMSGVRSGVNGTPTFFIEGERYDGAWEDGSLEAVLESVARGAGAAR